VIFWAIHQNSSDGRGFSILYLEGEADERISSWRDICKIDAFQDEDVIFQEDSMDWSRIITISVHREAIYAHQADAHGDTYLGSVL
jgi:hypothetical protein